MAAADILLSAANMFDKFVPLFDYFSMIIDLLLLILFFSALLLALKWCRCFLDEFAFLMPVIISSSTLSSSGASFKKIDSTSVVIYCFFH